jgi:hypothetical protein
MYAEYLKGFSLQEVGRIFGVTRQSVFAGFKCRELKLRKKQPLPYQFFNGIKFSLRNTGYYGRSKGKRDLIHRAVWEFYNGKIPPSHDIHHKDHDKGNNRIENLELFTKSEHAPEILKGQ